MGLSFDILIFDCLLKAPQPVTGLFFFKLDNPLTKSIAFVMENTTANVVNISTTKKSKKNLKKLNRHSYGVTLGVYLLRRMCYKYAHNLKLS